MRLHRLSRHQNWRATFCIKRLRRPSFASFSNSISNTSKFDKVPSSLNTYPFMKFTFIRFILPCLRDTKSLWSHIANEIWGGAKSNFWLIFLSYWLLPMYTVKLRRDCYRKYENIRSLRGQRIFFHNNAKFPNHTI